MESNIDKGSIIEVEDERDIDLLARTIWGEARGEGRKGMVAVAKTIMNRKNHPRRFPNTLRGVIKQPKQFSVWNARDRNRKPMLAVTERDLHFAKALEIARNINELADPTHGADHYHANWIATPRWARGATPTARIGQHIFYKLG